MADNATDPTKLITDRLSTAQREKSELLREQMKSIDALHLAVERLTAIEPVEPYEIDDAIQLVLAHATSLRDADRRRHVVIALVHELEALLDGLRVRTATNRRSRKPRVS